MHHDGLEQAGTLEAATSSPKSGLVHRHAGGKGRRGRESRAAGGGLRGPRPTGGRVRLLLYVSGAVRVVDRRSISAFVESLKSAQDTFNLFLRRHLAPGLRSLGFKGSGQNYLVANGEYWMQLGIQRSSFSDAAGIPFTINVAVADKRKWTDLRSHHPTWPQSPNANRFYGPAIWQSRIGSLLPEGTDKWWRVQPGTDAEKLATELLVLIRDIALPQMTARAVSSQPSSPA